jgi:hypothetical protein
LGVAGKWRAPTGCGLCGIESLTKAMRPPPKVGEGRVFTPEEIMAAVESLSPVRALNHETRAVHAAGVYEPNRGLVALGEDVGRHDALDKLVGALARGDVSARQGLVVLTSRILIEMVQKAAMIGAPTVAAVSAPTALAVRMAQAAGVTLIAIARKDGFEVFTRPPSGEGQDRESRALDCSPGQQSFRHCEILGLLDVEERMDLLPPISVLRKCDLDRRPRLGPGADLAHTLAKGVPLVRCHRNRPEPHDRVHAAHRADDKRSRRKGFRDRQSAD